MAGEPENKRSDSFEHLPPDSSELRVVLLGNSWSQRRFVGNLLLKDDAFDTEIQSRPIKISRPFQKQRISVIIAPDLLQEDLPEDRLTELLTETVEASAPGPHVFLLVLQPEDFTEQHKTRLQSVLERLSEQAFQRSLVLISTPREETPGFMEKYMNKPHIRDMIISCRYRYQWMNCTDGDPNMKTFKRNTLLARIGQMMENSDKHLNNNSSSQWDKAAQSPGTTGHRIISVNYEEEIKAALQNNDLAPAAEKAQKYLDEFNNVRLNIAVTGESGSGKSTLVNALRGIRNNTEGAAPVGFIETVMEPTENLHPSNPSISIWDLPGVGTTSLTAHEYLHYVEFEKYDFFIIVSSHHFTENDVKVAQEIQKMKKKFYFVRSKIDSNIQRATREDPNVKEEDVLKSVRNNCTEELQKLGCESPKIFLVSGFSLHLYEFKDLWKTLEMDLPDHQTETLLLALPNISLDVIEQKKKSLGSKIKWYTLSSSADEAVSVSSLPVTVDLDMMVTFTVHCVNSLGLSPESLQKLSAVSGVSVEDLTKDLKSPLAAAEVTPDLVLNVLGSSAVVKAVSVEDAARFLPIIGTVFTMTLSSVATYRVLNHILNTLAEDAHQVFKEAMGLNTSV